MAPGRSARAGGTRSRGPSRTASFSRGSPPATSTRCASRASTSESRPACWPRRRRWMRHSTPTRASARRSAGRSTGTPARSSARARSTRWFPRATAPGTCGCRSTSRTASTARPATSWTRTRSSPGSPPRAGADRATTTSDQTVRVGFYDDPAYREHDAGLGHPERPERLDALVQGLRQGALIDRLAALPARPATPTELLRVHTEDHVSLVASSRGRTFRFDPDTQAGPRSYDAALLAAGAAADAVDRVLLGEIDRAFCAVRPPGHHATADRAMGFCLFNNVAVAAAQALHRGLK